MAAPSIQKARNPNVNMTYSPSSDRALRAIADELRRIGDALESKAVHAVAADEAAATPDPVAATGEETAPALSPQEESLFQSLREWRAGEARKLGMPPYIVATDKVLRAVAQKRPASVEDLRQIPGFGPAKTAKYGAGVVEIVATA